MAINYQLTWKEDAKGRGRWRRMYRGKWFSYSGAGGKLKSYPAAWEAFQIWKLEQDNAAMNYGWTDAKEQRYQQLKAEVTQEYWQRNLRNLQANLINSVPDSIELRRAHALIESMMNTVPTSPSGVVQYDADPALESVMALVSQIIPRRDELTAPPEISPKWLESAIDRDTRPATLDEMVTTFLDDQRADAKNGSMSKSRFENIRANITTFTAYLGDDFAVDAINSKLEVYRDHIRKLVHDEKLSGYSGRDKLAAVRLLMVYANRKKWIPLDDIFTIKGRRGFNVKLVRGKVKAPALHDVERLAAVASERELLYLLLGINCGMTPMEISTVEHDHIGVGTITRKRNKTGESSTAPEVTYHLWPLTSKLLDKYRSDHKKFAILTQDGTPLVDHIFRPDGSVLKRDSIHSAWCRLCNRAGVKLPFKGLRKLSATLLQTSDHRDFVDLFLGHAAASMAAKHYVDSDADVLTFKKALQWLGEQYSAITGMKPSKATRKRS